MRTSIHRVIGQAIAAGVVAMGVIAEPPAVDSAPVKTPSAKPAGESEGTPRRVAVPPKEAAPAPQDRMAAAREQTILARSGFSPGLIDGKPGRKTRLAIEQWQRARGLEVTGVMDAATMAGLAEGDPLAAGKDGGVWTRAYTITEEDLALVTGPVPEDWNVRAELAVSGYADLEDLLAERGWCSVDLLRTLNPGASINDRAAGDEVVIPDVRDRPVVVKLARLEIVLGEKLMLGFDSSGGQVMLLHCSVAKMAEKRPVGELHVTVVATDPEYTFDPKDWPEVENVESKLRIAPGPRNPVGLAWIGLDRPGYGMHGTVRPQDIGKTGSHGCFRLLNWEALRLAHSVKVGMPVVVRE